MKYLYVLIATILIQWSAEAQKVLKRELSVENDNDAYTLNLNRGPIL